MCLVRLPSQNISFPPDTVRMYRKETRVDLQPTLNLGTPHTWSTFNRRRQWALLVCGIRPHTGTSSWLHYTTPPSQCCHKFRRKLSTLSYHVTERCLGRQRLRHIPRKLDRMRNPCTCLVGCIQLCIHSLDLKLFKLFDQLISKRWFLNECTYNLPWAVCLRSLRSKVRMSFAQNQSACLQLPHNLQLCPLRQIYNLSNSQCWCKLLQPGPWTFFNIYSAQSSLNLIFEFEFQL